MPRSTQPYVVLINQMRTLMRSALFKETDKHPDAAKYLLLLQCSSLPSSSELRG